MLAEAMDITKYDELGAYSNLVRELEVYGSLRN